MIVINQKFKMIIHKFRLTKTMPETAVSSKCPAQAATQSTPPLNNDVWVDIDNYLFDDPPELPYNERVNLAHKAFINSNRQEHIKVLARTFGIN